MKKMNISLLLTVLIGSSFAAPHKFAYVNNVGDQTISMYTFDPHTGYLSYMNPKTSKAPYNPYGFAIDQSGQYLYISQIRNPDPYIYMYKINQTTGKVTPLPSPKTQVEGCPTEIHTELESYVYTLDTCGRQLYIHTINPDGQLILVKKIVLPQDILANSISINPAKTILYINGLKGKAITSIYLINQNTGDLRFLDTVKAETGLSSIRFTPDNNFAYIADGVGIKMYSIESSDGQLIPLSPSKISSDANISDIKIDATGRYVYASNPDNDSISMYKINSDNGQLIKLSPFTIDTWSYPMNITIDPFNNFLYVTNYKMNNVGLYKIESTTGELSHLEQSGIGAGKLPKQLIFN